MVVNYALYGDTPSSNPSSPGLGHSLPADRLSEWTTPWLGLWWLSLWTQPQPSSTHPPLILEFHEVLWSIIVAQQVVPKWATHFHVGYLRICTEKKDLTFTSCVTLLLALLAHLLNVYGKRLVSLLKSKCPLWASLERPQNLILSKG